MLMYNREGFPITFDEFCKLGNQDSYRIVKQTEIGNVFVSTMWLGIDHGYGFTKDPLIFETIIFADDTHMYGRWETLEQAETMHKDAVKSVLSSNQY